MAIQSHLASSYVLWLLQKHDCTASGQSEAAARYLVIIVGLERTRELSRGVDIVLATRILNTFLNYAE